MINEKSQVEMCKIQQKHFLHNLLSVKESKIKREMNTLSYVKHSQLGKEIGETFRVELNGINKWKQTSIQFLLYCLHQATEKKLNANDRVLYLSPKEYLGYRNLKNQDSLRDKINSDLRMLINLHLTFQDLNFYTDKKTKQKCSYKTEKQMNICSQTCSYKRKIIQIAFTEEFIEYYRSLSCMNVPKEIFSIDTRRNPNALSILWKLSTLKNMNREKSNNGIISVTSLLNSCPTIPSYDEIKTGGQISQRIIRPFERDLNSLNSIAWYYIDSNGNKVDHQVKDFLEFVDLKIKYDFKEVVEI